VVALGLGACLLAAGCNNAGEGALSGAAIGALGGLAIGSLTGSAGAGAAIGAVAGAATGAVIGDQNQRNDNRARDRYNDNW
jgi:outer membrane lipoprotein SlyB